MAKTCVLLYDPAGSGWAEKLKQYCAIQALRLRIVEPSQLSRSVGELAKGTAGAAAPSPAAPIPEPVVIFCGLSGGQLDRMLAALRRSEAPRTLLKAVLTDSNAGWSFSALYAELCRERSELSRR